MTSYLFPTYARYNIQIEKAKGTIVVDEKGKEYLDFISGIAVCNLGHVPDAVKKAIQEQLDKVWHVSNLFENQLQEDVAKLLVENSCGDYAFFCNSGAEANEAAIKLARKFTCKTRIITFQQSFHGRTFATMSATGQKKIQTGYGPLLPTFEYLPYNDVNAIDQLIGQDDIAAIMIEMIQGEGGVNPAEYDFVQRLKEVAEKIGALFIVDEVQTGIGRTAKKFAYEHYDIQPDIITLAKGLGNGFPVGAIIGKEFLKDTFSPGSHGTTFGGNYLAMAAAKATLSIIFDDAFTKEVEEKAAWFHEQLKEKLSESEQMLKIKGKGFLIGIECKDSVAPIITNLRENGLLVLPAGEKVIRLLPPLNVTIEELTEALTILKSTLAGKEQPSH